MKRYIYLGMLLIGLIICFNIAAFADEPKEEQKAVKINDMLNKQSFTFVAQRAVPASLPSKQLSVGEYDLKMSKDTVNAYLPYYGRAYVAPINDAAGIKFTSTKFNYTKKEKKNGWDIEIKIKDNQQSGYLLNLFVSKSGMATLQVNDNTRQSILFNGYIKP